MKRDFIYRILGYVLAAFLLRYAARQVDIWVFWNACGYLDKCYPVWWLVVAAVMTLMSVILFLPAVVPKRHRGVSFMFLRFGVSLLLFCFYLYYLKKDGWIFHDWVAHPYLGECSGAHAGDLYIILLITLAYVSLPILGQEAIRWKEVKKRYSPEGFQKILRKRARFTAIISGAIVLILAIATITLLCDPQKEQRERVKLAFRKRGAHFMYTAPRRVKKIPLVGGIVSELLSMCNIMEFSGIVAIDNPVENEDLLVLSGYRNITDIILENSNVTDDGISYLLKVPNLKWVNVNGCAITDNSILDLIRIPKIRTLFIQDTLITKRGVNIIKSSLPNCTVFTTKEEPASIGN